MKIKSSFIQILVYFLVFTSCSKQKKQEKAKTIQATAYKQIVTDAYELEKPSHKANAVLVLFGGYPETANDIKREFKILAHAKQHNIAVVYANYNRKLWFENNELEILSKQLHTIFRNHQLATDNVYFGGFSSGGNVALLIGNYLAKHSHTEIQPKGIFSVDSPIDLSALYRSAAKNVQRNFSEVSVQEGRFLLKMLGDRFGNPATAIKEYEKYSVFTSETKYINNLTHLKNTKIRLYTEPDTLWWQQHRMATYDQMNAYYIKQLATQLTEAHFNQVSYIPTINRGYRANGERHPHSWSIVEPKALIDWMLHN